MDGCESIEQNRNKMRVFTFTYILTKVISFSFSNTLFIRTFGCRSFNWIHFFLLLSDGNHQLVVVAYGWHWYCKCARTTATASALLGLAHMEIDDDVYEKKSRLSWNRCAHAAQSSALLSFRLRECRREWKPEQTLPKMDSMAFGIEAKEWKHRKTEEFLRLSFFSGGNFLAGGWWLLKNCLVPHQTTFCSLPSGDLCMALEIY